MRLRTLFGVFLVAAVGCTDVWDPDWSKGASHVLDQAKQLADDRQVECSTFVSPRLGREFSEAALQDALSYCEGSRFVVAKEVDEGRFAYRTYACQYNNLVVEQEITVFHPSEKKLFPVDCVYRILPKDQDAVTPQIAP